MIIIDPNTRQFNVPGAELVFGVESDAGSERKYFQCPRYVGDNLDLASCFVRMNFRNANGAMDSYLVDDVTIDGENVNFSWVLSEKAVKYKGHVKFVVCVVAPNQKVEWHTTLGTGMVLEGLEPEVDIVAGTTDVVAQLVAMVEAQTAAVEAEGTTQIEAVQTAAKTAEAASVAEIEAKGENTRNSIPADYTALSEAVDGLVRGRAGAIVCEAAGSAVVVSDASDNYIQGLRIFGRSTQDGVPTPDAPVEIVSVESPVVTVCGKNLLAENTVEFVKHRYVMLGQTCSAGQYTFSAIVESTDADSDQCAIMLYLGENEMVRSALVNRSANKERVKLTLTTSATFDRVRIYASTGWSTSDGDTAVLTDMMFEQGGEASQYEPYSGQTVELTHTLPGIPVTSGGNYTDSDGQQWICDEVDLERGVYVQRLNQMWFDGSEIWGVYDFQAKYFGFSLSNVLDETHSRTPGISNQFDSFKQSVEDCIWVGVGNMSLYVITKEWSDKGLDAWKAHLNEKPLCVIYPRLTPIETPLSETEIAAYRALHSNYPNTTVLNDAGAHMVVKYAADTKLYIDNKIAALVGG